MPKLKRPPKLSRHKASGQAYVTWQYQRIYLGEYGSKEASANYARFLSDLVDLEPAASAPEPEAPKVGWITIVQLCAAFLRFADGWYRKDGQPTTQFGHVKQHVKILVEHFGKLPVDDFGPKRLKMIQSSLVGEGYSRVGVNARIGGIKRIFRWGESEELVPRGTSHALSTVRGLAKGRTVAPERPPVRPVNDATVDATIPYMPTVVADMVRFQRATGARPGEVCILRPIDVDRSEAVWTYRPASHKTEHHGKDRVIFVGPKAQAVLRRYLLRDAEAYCFSPAESVEKQLEKRHEARMTPLSQGNRPGSRHTRGRTRPAADRYVKDSYNRAIARAVQRANKDRRRKAKEGEEVVLLESWSPNRLRHTAATRIRREFGLEAAQVTLGHAKADITETYAERDAELARTVALKIG